MRALIRGIRRLAGVFVGSRRESELADEIESHLEMQIEDNRRQGMSPGEARRAALLKFGGVESVKEGYRDQRGLPLIETLGQDARLAFRVLRKSPGFALVAIISLALGIGANTAIFSLVHAVMLRPLPYAEPDRLVRVIRKPNIDSVTLQEFEYWKEHTSAFAAAAGDRGVDEWSLAVNGRTEWIRAMPVTTDFFRTLQVAPALGREFDRAETRPRGPKAIILSDRLWRTTFGSDASILGRVLALEDVSYTVVGVAPSAFWYPKEVDAFLPLQNDLGANTEMFARLKPGVSLQAAQAEMATFMENFRRENAESLPDRYQGLTAVPYAEWRVGETRTKLLLLMGAVGLLLLIACSNLASLLLARLRAREKEIAIRLALGGGRMRVMRQFLIENLLLSAAGTCAGLLGAYWWLDGLVALIPFRLPAMGAIRIETPVLLFAMLVTLVTALTFSAAPFTTASRINVQETLKAAARVMGSGRARQRGRSLLIAGEVALSVTLLIAAALLGQTLYRMHQEQLGFSPRGLTTFFVTPPARQANVTASRFSADMLERLQAIPGVQAAAAVNVLPLIRYNNFPAQRQGHPEQWIGGMEIRHITPGYFEIMGIHVLRGRTLTPDIASGSPVIFVSESLARQWWGAGSPLADHVLIGRFRGQVLSDDPPREVVGVVADTKGGSFKLPPRPTVYLPMAQSGYDGGMYWIVRAERVTGLPDLLRRAAVEAGSRRIMQRVRTMDEIVAATMSESRFDAWLFGAFAALALGLTLIGIYGLLSFTVGRRTSEIGVRMALGASRSHVVALILRQGLSLVTIGLVIGLGASALLTKSLSTLLFGVRPSDPLSFAAVAALCVLVGGVTSAIPAIRASKVDPVVALRSE